MLLFLAPSADAGLRAKTSLKAASGGTRIVVKLTSTRSLPARARPRAVRVRGGGRAYRLRRARRATSAAVKLGTWRSSIQRGSRAERIQRLAGKRVSVRVRSRAGTQSVRSTVRAPVSPAPEPPPGDDTPPAGSQPGDVTGQAAIDQMTAEIRGGAVRAFRSHDTYSETFELHLCEDERFRYYHHQTDGPFATEKIGRPWTVVEALIRADGSYKGARVHGTFTHRNDFRGGPQAINEPAEAMIENQNGQWYWDGSPVETFQASCDPTL